MARERRDTVRAQLEALFARFKLSVYPLVVGDALAEFLQDLVTTRPARQAIPGLVVEKRAVQIRLGGAHPGG